ATSAAFSIPIQDNTTYQPDPRTVMLDLSLPAGASGVLLGKTVHAVLAIVDDDALPSVFIADQSISEAAGTAFVNVTLTNPSTQTVKVDYATADGTAHAGTNYTAAQGTLTFMPLATTAPIPIVAI